MAGRYASVKVVDKHGKSRSVKKLFKNCSICGLHMFMVYHKKGSYYRKSRKKWLCESKICGHSFIEESEWETHVRNGGLDGEIGVLATADDI